MVASLTNMEIIVKDREKLIKRLIDNQMKQEELYETSGMERKSIRISGVSIEDWATNLVDTRIEQKMSEAIERALVEVALSNLFEVETSPKTIHWIEKIEDTMKDITRKI